MDLQIHGKLLNYHTASDATQRSTQIPTESVPLAGVVLPLFIKIWDAIATEFKPHWWNPAPDNTLQNSHFFKLGPSVWAFVDQYVIGLITARYKGNKIWACVLFFKFRNCFIRRMARLERRSSDASKLPTIVEKSKDRFWFMLSKGTGSRDGLIYFVQNIDTFGSE